MLEFVREMESQRPAQDHHGESHNKSLYKLQRTSEVSEDVETDTIRRASSVETLIKAASQQNNFAICSSNKNANDREEVGGVETLDIYSLKKSQQRKR